MGAAEKTPSPDPQSQNPREVLKKAVLKNASSLWEKTTRIALPIGAIGGFAADVLSPLGPIVNEVAAVTVVLCVISGIVWFGVKRRQIRAALADGHIDEAEYERIHNTGTWPTLFAFSLVASIVLLATAGAQKVLATEPDKGAAASVFPAIAKLQDSLFRLEESSKRIESKLDALSAKFDRLSQNSNVIEEPKSPEDYYFNARLYELRADLPKARAAYLEYVKSDLAYIDPHLSFANVLKLQDGAKSAYDMYGMFVRGSNPSAVLARALLLMDKDQRINTLERLAQDFPEYGPIQYYLSKEFAAPESGQQTLEYMKKEKAALDQLRALSQRGLFSKYYLDKRMAVGLEAEATQRAAKFNGMSEEYLNAPPKLTVLAGQDGWEGMIVLPFDAAEVFVRMPGEKEFRSTGFTDKKNAATGKPLPNTILSLSNLRQQGKIGIKYRDTQGVERGPFDTDFDPAKEFVSFAKRIMPHDAHELAPVHSWKGKKSLTLVQLFMFRSALGSVTIGPDPQHMDKKLKLPPASGLYSVQDVSPEDPLLVQEIPTGWARTYLRIEFADGTASETMSLD